MDPLFQEALDAMDAALEVFSARVPSPERRTFKNGFVFRYREQSIHQALIQKLAKVVSGLRAAQILLEYGFVQEQAALQRMLDEFQEDSQFLAYAILLDETTDLHRRYLTAFYQEDYENPDRPVETLLKRPMIPREKIQKYLAGISSRVTEGKVSRDAALSTVLSKVYSGFVHGASPHIMDMYGGAPPRFNTKGMLGTPRIDAHSRDLGNYFFRGMIAFATAEKAFGADEVASSILAVLNKMRKQLGVE